MQRFIQRLFGYEDDGNLSPEFVNLARKFYDNPESRWEPVTTLHKTFYVLRHDATRLQTIDRLTYLDRECTKLFNKLVADPRNHSARKTELRKLRDCLVPVDGVCRIAQKPFGGYDVRAYAHDSWIFIELPTFASIESGQDGINVTEERRRLTLLHIVLHELAHVAGYWEHNDKHEKCIAWLRNYV